MLVLAYSLPSFASTCVGKWVNPITDICWSCLKPIQISSIKIGSQGVGPKYRDTKNPSSPVCMCTKANIPIPGLPLGFWEPLRLVDVTRTPFCMVGMGGVRIGGSSLRQMGVTQQGFGKYFRHESFYHVHYYMYPLISWLELITDFACLEKGSFDIGYMSEFDPMWNDTKLQSILNPEVALFANPLAQHACIGDCTAASLNFAIDKLFWCAGCLGNLYPFSGFVVDHVGGIQAGSLLTMRVLAKMHRLGLAQDTSTDNARVNGPLCRKRLALRIKKSQYKIQTTYPKADTKGANACVPIGASDLLYSPGKEFPGHGQDFGFLIWRKLNCCLF
jgi:conjugal transfer pilus assembly protein TraU